MTPRMWDRESERNYRQQMYVEQEIARKLGIARDTLKLILTYDLHYESAQNFIKQLIDDALREIES